MNQEPSGNGWSEWSKYILSELKRLNKQFEKLDERLDEKLENIIQRLVKVERVVWALAGAFCSCHPSVDLGCYRKYQETDDLLGGKYGSQDQSTGS